jgi:hypothetical protein
MFLDLFLKRTILRLPYSRPRNTRIGCSSQKTYSSFSRTARGLRLVAGRTGGVLRRPVVFFLPEKEAKSVVLLRRRPVLYLITLALRGFNSEQWLNGREVKKEQQTLALRGSNYEWLVLYLTTSALPD